MSIDGPSRSPINPNNSDIRNTLEDGIKYFSNWFSVEEGSINDSDIKLKLVLKELDYDKNKLILYDNLHNMEIEVSIINGSPLCTTCRTDDCSHVGFAIGAIQNRINTKKNGDKSFSSFGYFNSLFVIIPTIVEATI
ncbi:MAG: hypothetical protein ACE5SW_01925 [Nitrososphaeraceae archaeon]